MGIYLSYCIGMDQPGVTLTIGGNISCIYTLLDGTDWDVYDDDSEARGLGAWVYRTDFRFSYLRSLLLNISHLTVAFLSYSFAIPYCGFSR
jgi:hypothetical protein